MIGCIYFNLDHVMLGFSLSLDHSCSSSNIQLISISYVSLLSFSQHHHFRIYFIDNEFKKTY
jgi:hypothetical protein